MATKTHGELEHTTDNHLIYDGDCPFCSRYVRLTRLKNTVGPLKLIDARSDAAEVRAARTDGYILDEGMLLRLNGSDFFGADCLSTLALLSSRSTAFNRVTYFLLRHPSIARLVYPILRFGRSSALRIMGRNFLGY